MGTNGSCPNMGILYTDDISNLHIWAQKGQGLTDTEIQSRATDPAAMPIYGHVHLAKTSGATDPATMPICGHSALIWLILLHITIPYIEILPMILPQCVIISLGANI